MTVTAGRADWSSGYIQAELYKLLEELGYDVSDPAEFAHVPSYAYIGPDQCTSAADQENGKCKIGWITYDIQVTANNDFLAANPAAEALFEAVKLSMIDVSLAIVAQDEGESPTDLAIQWLADNRDLADGWVRSALAAA